jgi:hypothetical protein
MMAKKDSEPQTAEALKESATQMRKAEKNLPGQPKDAQSAMQAAARNLQKASQQAGKQASRALPSAARNAPNSAMAIPGIFPGSLAKQKKLEESKGGQWGVLPGQLTDQMIQDARVRYSEDYAELIEQYFRSLSESSRKEK